MQPIVRIDANGLRWIEGRDYPKPVYPPSGVKPRKVRTPEEIAASTAKCKATKLANAPAREAAKAIRETGWRMSTELAAASAVLLRRATVLERFAARNAAEGKDNGARCKLAKAAQLRHAAAILGALPGLGVSMTKLADVRTPPAPKPPAPPKQWHQLTDEERAARLAEPYWD